MNLQQAILLAKYRLFRPLTIDSIHYPRYPSDGDIVQSILRWTSKIKLGGHIYDLAVQPHQIFQIQSNFLNRQVFLIPLVAPELTRDIVLKAEIKSNNAQKGCESGLLEQLPLIGGLLVLKRLFFRGTVRFREQHESDSGWFIEDRYYFDAIIRNAHDQRQEKKAETKRRKAKGETQKKPQHSPLEQMPWQPILRVFYDSVGCASIPSIAPHPNIDVHNTSIRTSLTEYYPPSEVFTMTWHELAVHLGLESTGIYAISNFIASELEQGRYTVAAGLPIFLGENTVSDTSQETNLTLAIPILWSRPGQPLSPELTNTYDRFYVLPPPVGSGLTATKVPFLTSTYTKTALFNSNLSSALVAFLLERSGGNAQYLGNGLFHVHAQNATTLAAGTGNWGSGESASIRITTSPEDATQNDISGQGYTQSTGGATRLVTDLIRYEQREQIARELEACRQNATSECIECVENSTAQDFHTAGKVADFVDMVSGIAACILWPYSCPATLPAASGAAKTFFDNVIDGYDYAEDVCYGATSGAPFQALFDRACVTNTVSVGWGPSDPPTSRDAWRLCRDGFGDFLPDGKTLVEAWWSGRDSEGEKRDPPGSRRYWLACKYCDPLVA